MSSNLRANYLLGIIFGLYIFLLFYYIGDYPVWNKDEGLYAETVREMIERGNLLDPYYNYEHRWQKPILIYWVLMPFAYFFGASAFTIRLSLALLGVATLILTYFFAKKLFNDRKIALFSTFLLASSAGFIMQSRHIVTHLMLLFTIVASFYFMYDLLRGKRDRKTILLFGAMVGLSFLAKLYVGVVFILTTGFLLGFREIWSKKIPFLKASLWGVLSFSVVALPWYLYMMEKYGAEYLNFLYHEFFDRITISYTGKSTKSDPFFYVRVFFGLFAPWSILLLVALGVEYSRNGLSRVKKAFESLPLAVILTGFFVVLITLSIPKSKIPSYLLSLQIFASITTAYIFTKVKFNNTLKYAFLTIQIVLTVAVVVVWLLYFDYKSWEALFMLLLLGVSFSYPLHSYEWGFIRVGLVAWVVYFSILGNLYREIVPTFFPFDKFGKKVASINQTQKQKIPLYSYKKFWQALPFYAKTKMNTTQKLPNESRFFLVIDPKEFHKLDKTAIKWEILDRGKYYKHSYSKLFKIINIKKGYSSAKDSGDIFLLFIEKK